MRCSEPQRENHTFLPPKLLLPNTHLPILQMGTAEGSCSDGVSDSFSFLFEAQQQEMEKREYPSGKTASFMYLLHSLGHRLGDNGLLLTPRGSDALNPRPHTKVPGLAACEHRVLRYSLPHQSGKAFPVLGMLLQRSKGRISASCQFSVLEPAAVCTDWEARNVGELQDARITRASELRQTRRGLKLQFLSPFHESSSTQV